MRHALLLAALVILLAGVPSPAEAQAKYDNPMLEVTRSIVYGGLAGLMLGSAVAVVADGSDSEPIKWGFVIGTFVGAAAGLYAVSHRPDPGAWIEIDSGALRAGRLGLEASPAGGVRAHVVAVSF